MLRRFRAAADRAVLVVGGAGTFGSRLVEGLLAATDLRVVVARRSLTRARAFADACNASHPGGRATAVELDAAHCGPEELRPAAASVTAVPRSLASAAAPLLSGWLLGLSAFGWPLVIAGTLKAACDPMLLRAFARVKPPEEA